MYFYVWFFCRFVFLDFSIQEGEDAIHDLESNPFIWLQLCMKITANLILFPEILEDEYLDLCGY